MNTEYKLGNVLRSQTDFTNFKFPNELPTEEWAGSEVRSYNNYIRPVANLFDNDRENYAFIKDIFLSNYYNGTGANVNSVIYGCNVVKTGDFYEVQRGAFLGNGKLYYIYPNCGGEVKQIQSEYISLGYGELDLHISYDYETGIYSYDYTKYTTPVSSEGTAANAVTLLDTLISELELTSSPVDHILLPVVSGIGEKVYFDNNEQKVFIGTPVLNNYVEFATIEVLNGVSTIVPTTILSTTNGNRINVATINNESLKNNTITIGDTVVELGNGSDEFTGIERINSIKPHIDNNKLYIDGYNGSASSASYAVIADDIYNLDTACTKAYTEDTTLAASGEVGKLPTAATVKTYVDNQINGDLKRRNEVTFLDGIKLSSGAMTIDSLDGVVSKSKVVINNSADASRTGGAVSGTASIYTIGGVEAGGSIYADGNIVGLNSGTYSKREYKENITPFTESAVDLINGVDIVNYTYKSDKAHNHKIGFIADDTHEYFATKNHDIMDQSNCIGILLRAVQELSAQNSLLKLQLDAQKEMLEKINGHIESRS